MLNFTRIAQGVMVTCSTYPRTKIKYIDTKASISAHEDLCTWSLRGHFKQCELCAPSIYITFHIQLQQNKYFVPKFLHISF